MREKKKRLGGKASALKDLDTQSREVDSWSINSSMSAYGSATLSRERRVINRLHNHVVCTSRYIERWYSTCL